MRRGLDAHGRLTGIWSSRTSPEFVEIMAGRRGKE